MTQSPVSRTLPALLLAWGALTAAAPEPVAAQPAAGASNLRNDPDFYVGLWVT